MCIVLATVYKMTARSFLIYLDYFTNSLCVMHLQYAWDFAYLIVENRLEYEG